MNRDKIISMIQVTILLICSFGVWQFSSQRDTQEDRASAIEVEDSNGVVHKFDFHPQRVAITNTYAGTVMRMLEIDESVIVGVSGDFHDESSENSPVPNTEDDRFLGTMHKDQD